MKRYLLSVLTGCVFAYTGAAKAEDITAIICHDRNGSDQCTSSEAAQTITEDWDGTALPTSGEIDRTVEDDDERSFPVHVDFADEGAENLCKYEALISYDPDTLHVHTTTENHGVATSAGGTYSQCTRLHDKTPPSGWPGLTSKAVCYIAETDYLFSPEGDLEMGDGAEIGVQFEVINEAYVTAARTGAGRVVLKNLKKYHVVDDECVQDTSVTQVISGTVDFTVVDESESAGTGNDGVACGELDIDGDKHCEISGTYGDNCGGFWGQNWLQTDTDGDGYGNACDTDVTGDCIQGGPDLSKVALHYGDSYLNNWNKDSHGASGHGQAYDFSADGEVDTDDSDMIWLQFGSTIGPTFDSNWTDPVVCDNP